MKTSLCVCVLMGLVLTIGAAGGEPKPVAPLGVPPLLKKPDAKPGVVLHEWGVFTVLPNEPLANIHNRLEWEGLPPFVYGQLKGRVLPRTYHTAVNKPVVFFHTEAPCTLSFTVSFPGGAPAVWWPATRDPAGSPGSGRGLEIGGAAAAKLVEPPAVAHDKLSWSVQVFPDGQEPRDAPALREVPADHWFRRLRTVKADDIQTTGDTGHGRRMGIQGPIEREAFVYYDGLFPNRDWMAISATAEKLSLTNRAKVALLDVTVIERTLDGGTRVARLAKMEPGQSIERVELQDVPAADWPKSGQATLTDQLTAAGLNRDEAESLVEIWKSDFFEEAGLRVMYRLPQEEYDRLLPMRVDGVFGVTHVTAVRVGLVFHPDCGPPHPELLKRLTAAVKQLDHDDFAVRERATADLAKLGRAARGPLLELLAKGGLPAEAESRIRGLLLARRADEVLPQLKSDKP